MSSSRRRKRSGRVSVIRRQTGCATLDLRLDRRSAEELALELKRLARQHGVAVEVSVKEVSSTN